MIPEDGRRHAPATLRNREPIRAVLAEVLPERGDVLEIGSGSGEHVVFFAEAFPDVVWQPSDADPDSLVSIAAWSAAAGLPNLRPPVRLDVTEAVSDALTGMRYEALICINMIHIAPWQACRGLMAVAKDVVRPEGILVLYGPFREGGGHTAPSNAAFDAHLRTLDPRFGVRDLEEVTAEAAARGFALDRRFAMPANNLTLVFRRRVTPD